MRVINQKHAIYRSKKKKRMLIIDKKKCNSSIKNASQRIKVSINMRCIDVLKCLSFQRVQSDGPAGSTDSFKLFRKDSLGIETSLSVVLHRLESFRGIHIELHNGDKFFPRIQIHWNRVC